MNSTVFIKQFGLYRSGTNITKAILELKFKNLLVKANVFGHKHNPFTWDSMENWIPEEPIDEYGLTIEEYESLKGKIHAKDLKFVINIKEPLSWLVSYYYYRYKKLNAINDVVDFPFSFQFCRDALEMWFTCVSSWMNFEKDNASIVYVLDSFSLISDPGQVIDDIRNKFELEYADSDDKECIITSYAKAGNDKMIGKDLVYNDVKFDRHFYLDGIWMSEYCIPLLENINGLVVARASVDKSVARALDIVNYDSAYCDCVNQRKASECNMPKVEKCIFMYPMQDEAIALCGNGKWSCSRRIKVGSESDCIVFTKEEGSNSIQVFYRLDKMVRLYRFVITIEVDGWESIDYVACGYRNTSERFLHVKQKVTSLDGLIVCDVCVDSAMWRLYNRDFGKTYSDVDNIIVFVKGRGIRGSMSRVVVKSILGWV